MCVYIHMYTHYTNAHTHILKANLFQLRVTKVRVPLELKILQSLSQGILSPMSIRQLEACERKRIHPDPPGKMQLSIKALRHTTMLRAYLDTKDSHSATHTDTSLWCLTLRSPWRGDSP